MDKLKYRLDLLEAYNEKLCDSDRMYRMIADSTGNMYIYRNYKHNIKELTGPFEQLFGVKKESRFFDEEELKDVINEEDFTVFTDKILGMEREKKEREEVTVGLLNGGKRLRCIGLVYYDDKNEPTDKLIGLEILRGEE